MKKTRILNTFLTYPIALLVFAFSISSCGEDDDMPPVQEEPNIVEVASANNEFSVLVNAVQAAGLTETLSGTGPFTVFAPTNDAFGRYLTYNSLEASELLGADELSTVLTYHVVPSEVPSTAVEAGRVNSVAGVPFFISVSPTDEIWINGSARVTETDINASNGVIHAINYVIVPPTQNIAEIAIDASESADPEFTQLVAALIRTDLASTFMGGFDDNYTVFAPTDAAFQDLYTNLGVSNVDQIDITTLTNVLLYHVVPARAFSQDLREGGELPTLFEGETLKVNLAGLSINQSGLVADMLNIHATNGVIHVIDTVLLP